MTLSLFDSLTIGSIDVSNRIAMAPMTRARAPELIATASTATYYAQRASTGLIITEATQISARGTGSIFTPGIYTPEMVKGWRQVTSAVHDAGGKILAQIWHVGRVSHSSFHGGDVPLAPSATPGQINTFTMNGYEPATPPRAMTLDEVAETIEAYRQAAVNAVEAGFDGVQIHGANGYLIDQFLRDGVNKREDQYGGSIENRCRFALEVVDACCAAIGSDRVSLRISPFHNSFDCASSDTAALFQYLVAELEKRKLAILDIVERGLDPAEAQVKDFDFGYTPATLREIYTGPIMVNGQYDLEAAKAVIASGHAQMVGIARPFMSNPDLALRWQRGEALRDELDVSLWYGGGDEGYTDQLVAS